MVSGAMTALLALGSAAQQAQTPPAPPPAPPEAQPEPSVEPSSSPPAEAPPSLDAIEAQTGSDLAPGQTPSEPTEVTIFLKDGQRFTGLLVEQNEQQVVLRIEGIQTRFPASAVDRVRVMRPILERYEEMRAAMGDDPSQIVRLADWLRARDHLELALAEVERALMLAPDHAEARLLRVLIAKQIELRERARPGASAAEMSVETAPSSDPANLHQLNFPLLTPEQIALIKVYEVDLKKSPRIVIRRETIDRLLDRYRTHHLIPSTQEGREAIYRWTPREVLDLMFRVQARDLYPEVIIVDQPESIRLFRDTVHRTWLINACATNDCHGGRDAGRLMLSNRRPNAEASVYTNLLILERFRLDDGTPLLNYENPERSPLLHLALPRENAIYQHPRVPTGVSGADGWKPVFRSTNDRRFQQAVEWMRSMYRPRPEYPIDYTPPGPSEPLGEPAANLPR